MAESRFKKGQIVYKTRYTPECKWIATQRYIITEINFREGAFTYEGRYINNYGRFADTAYVTLVDSPSIAANPEDSFAGFISMLKKPIHPEFQKYLDEHRSKIEVDSIVTTEADIDCFYKDGIKARDKYNERFSYENTQTLYFTELKSYGLKTSKGCFIDKVLYHPLGVTKYSGIIIENTLTYIPVDVAELPSYSTPLSSVYKFEEDLMDKYGYISNSMQHLINLHKDKFSDYGLIETECE